MMIMVEGNSEISEKNQDTYKEYLDIRPVRWSSDQDVAESIKKEFEDAHKVAELDNYETLLSEVFNRSEEELSISFELTDKNIELLEKFRPEQWKSLEDTNRTNLINELSNTIGEVLELDNLPAVIITETDDSYGFYNPENNTVIINSRFLSNPIELVDTIAHEMRHAYQHMRSNILETREDALYKVNYENYISPEPLSDGGWQLFTDYYNQYVEVDARTFATKFTEAML